MRERKLVATPEAELFRLDASGAPRRKTMKAQPLLALLTLVNAVLLAVLLARGSPAHAGGEEGVLRGRALEIVDEHGRVRATIQVHPPGKAPDGSLYPDTVILRLIDPDGRPEVKLAASRRGAGLGLLGATDATRALLSAEGAEPLLRLTSADGRQQVLAP